MPPPAFWIRAVCLIESKISSMLSRHGQHEAGAEHAHLAAGVHQRRAVGHEPPAGHQLVEALLPARRGRLAAAVEALDVGDRVGDPAEQILGRLDHLARRASFLR